MRGHLSQQTVENVSKGSVVHDNSRPIVNGNTLIDPKTVVIVKEKSDVRTYFSVFKLLPDILQI